MLPISRASRSPKGSIGRSRSASREEEPRDQGQNQRGDDRSRLNEASPARARSLISASVPAAADTCPKMWPKTPAELIRRQRELAGRRPAGWRPSRPRLVAGCFVCFARGASGHGRAGEPGWAAAALIGADRHLAGTTVVRGQAGGPYEPGLLALREGPLLEAAVRALAGKPEVVIANATGRDHPQGAGLALHLGAVLDLPSVGLTDCPLLAVGAEPGPERGATSPLLLEGAEVARLLRTRVGARPVVVHSGWRTDLDAAVSVVLAAIRGARMPEPLREARREARRARATEEGALQ
jgi:deoxyribonuclease V